MNEPPVIQTVIKRRRRSTALYALIALGAALLIGILFGCHVIRPEPPKEKELLQFFYEHRAAFEKVKEMFEEDQKVALGRVGSFGIVTQKPFFHGKPPVAHFSLERYQQYLRLLDQVGCVQVYRAESTPGNPTFGLWQGLWLRNRLNIHLVWLDAMPTNQIRSLDDCRLPRRDWQFFYKHIDGNWYFETDMRPF